MYLRLMLATLITSSVALAMPEVGKPAPAFTATDANGKVHNLADFKGKTVVLEWNNPECPFVKKHYNASTNMQNQQAAATKDGVVWLSVNSGAAGKQGHMSGADATAKMQSLKAANSAYLIDADGKVGQAYGAKTTPHMFIIDAQGVLRYAGAIDSNPSADAADIPAATQYVPVALAELKAGKPVTTAVTKPYGCSVKY
jgi:alkyl hydroperoxide reductase subunit AhpC